MSGKGGLAISHRVDRGSNTEKVTFKLRLSRESALQASGKASAKALGWGHACMFEESVSRPVELEVGNQEERGGR